MSGELVAVIAVLAARPGSHHKLIQLALDALDASSAQTAMDVIKTLREKNAESKEEFQNHKCSHFPKCNKLAWNICPKMRDQECSSKCWCIGSGNIALTPKCYAVVLCGGG